MQGSSLDIIHSRSYITGTNQDFIIIRPRTISSVPFLKFIRGIYSAATTTENATCMFYIRSDVVVVAEKTNHEVIWRNFVELKVLGRIKNQVCSVSVDPTVVGTDADILDCFF